MASSIAVIPRDQISACVCEWVGDEVEQSPFLALVLTPAAVEELACVVYSSPHLSVVCRLFDDLGSHPERGPNKRVPPVHGIGELSRHTKVCQLHFPSL